jgi:hypothetical protein
MFSDVQRVTLLEQDLDHVDDWKATVATEMRALQSILTKILIALVVASVMLAINVVVLRPR